MSADSGKIYFASDFHLGVPDYQSSLIREKRVVRWLDFIKADASAVYLVGDLFDFWFEYKHVIPKGFSRLIGKLCELQDLGIQIHLFHGNHDLWQFGYFEKEIGCTVHDKPITLQLGQHTFYVAHGDGLGPGQTWFKFILSIYRNRFFQRLFALLHPTIGIRVANWFSGQSKLKTAHSDNVFLGNDKEYVILHAEEIMKIQKIDFFIYGHRHLPFDISINGSRILNLGDWFSHNTYAVYDGNKLELNSFVS